MLDSDGVIDSLLAIGLRAVQVHGPELQTAVALEELGELISIICRRARQRATHGEVASEIADVLIVCAQLAQTHTTPALVREQIEHKMHRLARRLASGEGEIA